VSLLQGRVENRGEVAGRGVDNAEHLAHTVISTATTGC
jgi:hypothetical protein